MLETELKNVLFIRNNDIDDAYAIKNIRNLEFNALSFNSSNISEEFILDNIEKFNLNMLMIHRTLSENLLTHILKQPMIDFAIVSEYQNLTDALVKKYYKKLDIELLNSRGVLSPELKKLFNL